MLMKLSPGQTRRKVLVVRFEKVFVVHIDAQVDKILWLAKSFVVVWKENSSTTFDTCLRLLDIEDLLHILRHVVGYVKIIS